MDIYSVFGNKIRVQLLMCLSRSQKNVTEMIATCGLSQSAVSQHLSKLKRMGLIVSEKDGKERIYSLRYKKVIEICRMFDELQKEVS